MKVKGRFSKRKAASIAVVLFVIFLASVGGTDDVAATVGKIATEQVKVESTQESEMGKSFSDELDSQEPEAKLNDIGSEKVNVSIPASEPEEAKGSGETERETVSVLQVHFLDVGQALSVLVMDGQGNELLYDAGNEGDAEFVMSYLKDLGIDRLEYVVNSHPHEDHIGGMDRVLETFEVDQVLLSTKDYDSQAYRDVMHALEEHHVEAVYPKAGTIYNLGALEIQVLGPLGSNYENTNDYSVILKIKSASQSILLVGDSEAVSEHELVAAGVDLQADVFQVSHHGSSTSNTIQYLSKIDPDYAVISVGADNSYGHPDATILERLRNMGISTYETDLDGTIVMTLDGSQIFIETFEAIGTGVMSEVVRVDTDEKTVVEERKSIEDLAETKTEIAGIEIGSSVVITELNKSAEYVIIQNVSEEAVELGGWQLISVTGSQTFHFPEGCKIDANQFLKITSHNANGTGDFIMAKGYVWNNDTSDPAQLLDAQGMEVDFFKD